MQLSPPFDRSCAADAERYSQPALRHGCSTAAGQIRRYQATALLLLLSAAAWHEGWLGPDWSGRARTACAQETGADDTAPAANSDGAGRAEQEADEVLADPATTASKSARGAGAAPVSLLDLMLRGGWLMLPIVLLSIIVVAIAIERALGLRQRKVIPAALVSGLGELAREDTGFEPRKAYHLCEQHPSAAATIIRTMLLKVGRPHAEVEHAVTEASEREAARLYKNVRTLNLSATVSPLLGLLGTVWGMIKAFMATAAMPVGANKAEHLAEGIYTALVTTFAGLAVAIPAAVLAHLFEGRIQALLREVDELLFSLLPQVERFEGRLRVSQPPLTEPGGCPRPAAADSAAPAQEPSGVES